MRPLLARPSTALGHGSRRARLGKQHLRDGVLTFIQVKNVKGKPVRLQIPAVPELARFIAATPAPGGLTFLTSELGKACTVESFGNRFRAWCRAAGLPRCSPHELSKAAAGRLAELGASAHAITVVTGHLTLKEVDRCTPALPSG